MASATYQQRIAHGLKRGSIRGWKAYAQGIGPIVGNYWRGRRLTLPNGGGVECDLFRGEAGSRRNCRINLEGNRRSADGVVDSVEKIHHTFDSAFSCFFVGANR